MMAPEMAPTKASKMARHFEDGFKDSLLIGSELGFNDGCPDGAH
jgi:hypothetical protein